MAVEVLLAAAVFAIVVLLVPTGAAAVGESWGLRAPERFAAWVRTRALPMRAARSAARTRESCLDLLDALAAELRAGRPAPAALARAAAPYPGLLVHTLGAHRLGGDLPAGLDVDAAANGAPVLRRLAACWRVGESTGAGLADAVGRLAVSTRESERVRLELAARTAEPRATMRVLAALPAFGLVLGAGLGADTVGWLFGTPAGRIVLALGLALEVLGLLWARRLIGSIEAAL
jgi:tight adherence protein B